MVSPVFITFVLSIFESSLKNDHQWIQYKEKFNKNYPNSAEEIQRYNNFQENNELIKTHNEKFYKGKVTYTMGHNQFSDLTSDEFLKINLSSLKVNLNETLSYYPFRDFTKNPDSLSYQSSCISPPLDQGNCGCCWAFAVSAQVEAQLKRKDPKYNTYLSPQYLYDCSAAGDCK
jgi:cathepsin L